MDKIIKEIAVMIVILIVSYVIFGNFDLLEKIVELSRHYENYEIDELISTAMVLVVLLLIFSIRRWLEVIEKTKELQNALDEIEVLRGIIPICAYCKKIRDDEGVWRQLEAYICSHSDVDFSHGVCPECYKKQMAELD